MARIRIPPRHPGRTLIHATLTAEVAPYRFDKPWAIGFHPLCYQLDAAEYPYRSTAFINPIWQFHHALDGRTVTPVLESPEPLGSSTPILGVVG